MSWKHWNRTQMCMKYWQSMMRSMQEIESKILLSLLKRWKYNSHFIKAAARNHTHKRNKRLDNIYKGWTELFSWAKLNPIGMCNAFCSFDNILSWKEYTEETASPQKNKNTKAHTHLQMYSLPLHIPHWPWCSFDEEINLLDKTCPTAKFFFLHDFKIFTT